MVVDRIAKKPLLADAGKKVDPERLHKFFVGARNEGCPIKSMSRESQYIRTTHVGLPGLTQWLTVPPR